MVSSLRLSPARQSTLPQQCANLFVAQKHQPSRSRKRKLENDLEDSRIEEARRVEDIRRRSTREKQAIDAELVIARKRADMSG